MWHCYAHLSLTVTYFGSSNMYCYAHLSYHLLLPILVAVTCGTVMPIYYSLLPTLVTVTCDTVMPIYYSLLTTLVTVTCGTVMPIHHSLLPILVADSLCQSKHQKTMKERVWHVA